MLGRGLELTRCILHPRPIRWLDGHARIPFGDVRLVTVKALLPAELEYVSKHGADGASELARRFAENGEEHISRASRQAFRPSWMLRQKGFSQ